MRCRQCGHQIDTSHRFCAFCGADWMADAGGRADQHDEGAVRKLYDDKASLLTGEEMLFALDDDAIDEDSLVFSSYEDGRRSIRWVPIAVSLFSVLLLVGIIIGIWLQFFSKDKEDTEFSDPTQPTYNIQFSHPIFDRESTTSRTTESTGFSRESTTTTPTTTPTTEESTTDTTPTTQPTTTPPSAEVVIVTDPPVPVTDPPMTQPTETVPVPTPGSPQVTTSDEVTEYATSTEVVTTPSTATMSTPATTEEEPETTESQPHVLLSIDNVYMDKWPGVRLHFSYVPQQMSPPSTPEETDSEKEEQSTTSEPTVLDDELPDEPSVPPPFDIRFLSVFESETEDGVWTQQFIIEEKSVSKLLIVAETSQAMTKTLSIEVLRSSLTAFVESMDFIDEESDRKGDALGLMQFSDSETLLSEVTGNKQEVLDAISKLEEGADESALWKSLYLAFDHTPDYGAIILITKGEDTGVMWDSLYVRLMANQKGIPIYTVLIKTEESDLSQDKEEHFRLFSEITGGCCYVIDMTAPETDIAAGLEAALTAAYGAERQNRFVFYESKTRVEAVTRFVKIMYAPEGQEAVESEIVSYSIPSDTEDYVPETRHNTESGERRVCSGRREREKYT